MPEKTKFIGTGKRKTSIARVSLFSPGKGKIEINGLGRSYGPQTLIYYKMLNHQVYLIKL